MYSRFEGSTSRWRGVSSPQRPTQDATKGLTLFSDEPHHKVLHYQEIGHLWRTYMGIMWRIQEMQGCATEVSPLKYISVAHAHGAPQKYTKILWRTRQRAPQKYFSGASSCRAPQKQVRHRKKNTCATEYLYRYSQICTALYKYIYIYIYRIYTDIQDLYKYN